MIKTAFASPNKIQQIFTDVSPVYDIMNDFMSFGLHHAWKDIFIEKLPLPTFKPLKAPAYLDMASGTGDIALKLHKRLLRENIPGRITVCDKNESMLKKGREKHAHMPWCWVASDATNLCFQDETFDLYLVSFGLRNMPPLKNALSEALRVLKKGGFYYILEFSHPPSPFLKGLYDLYAKTWLPFLGSVFAKKPSAYRYLIESIEQFPKASLLESMIAEIGFENTGFENLMGGIVTIHWGQKPTGDLGALSQSVFS